MAWTIKIRADHIIQMWRVAERRLRRRALTEMPETEQALVIAAHAVAFAAFTVQQLNVEDPRVRELLDQVNGLGVLTGTQWREYHLQRAHKLH